MMYPQEKHEYDVLQTERSVAWVVLATLVLTIAGLCWVVWSIYADSYRDAEIQNDWMLEVLEVREEIIHLDEVLTNSARMAAETGDNKWEQRYREYEPKLGATISRAIELVPALLQTEGAATTDAANVALVEMEEQAFDFVRQGRPDRARQLLYSSEYEQQKHIYTTGMHQFQKSLHTAVHRDREARQQANSQQIVVVASIALAFCLVWIMVYRILGRWRANMYRIYRQATEDRDSLQREVEHRTRAETALLRSEERFKDFAEASSDWLWELDENLRFSYFAGRDAGVTGATSDSLLGKTFEEVGTAQGADPTVWRQVCADLAACRPFRNCVLRRVYADERVLHFSFSGIPVFGKAGNFEGYRGTGTDITALKIKEEALFQAEVALRESEARFKQAARLTGLGHWSWNEVTDRIEHISEEAALIHGVSIDEFLSAVTSTGTYVKQIHPDDRERYESYIESVLIQDRSAYDITYRIVRFDGEIRYVRQMGEPIIDESGAVIRSIGTIQDITAIKQHEEALLQAKADAERAAEIARDLAERAEAASRMKTEFLATMSHEIRTPMNGVLGGTELLSATTLSQDQKCHLNVIRESARGLLSLLNDILDISKIESGHLALEEIDFDFIEFVKNVYTSWQSRFQSRGLSMDLHMDSDLPKYLKGDPTRLRQILVNLLGNAYKFTSDGGVALRAVVVGGCTEGNAVSVRFEVEDSGAGVPEAARDEIFEKFTQADPSTTRKYGGTGLGLAICKQLATLMGGEIGYDSTEGEGSTFWFTIVCQLGEGGDTARGDNAEHIDLPPLRILVAEDNRINQQVIIAILDSLGHQVHMVGNGLEAVAAVFQSRYDLVLMDVNMPELDGIEATRRIRALLGPEAGIPIIAVTADALLEQRQQCLDAGMNDHVTKPIILEELVQAMARWTSQTRLDEVSGEATTSTPPTPIVEKETSPSIDMDILSELADMVGWEVVAGLFEKLVDDFTARSEIMTAAVEAGDADVLAREAHSLKSTLGQFGATRAYDTAYEIDALCKAGNGEAARQLVPQFIQQCDEALTELRQNLADTVPLQSSGT